MIAPRAPSKIGWAWPGLIAVETLCQIAVKLSGEHTGPLALTAHAAWLVANSVWFWVALVCYLAGFALWMTILSRSALSLAFPASAAVFVGAMAASVVLFHEPLSASNTLGTVAILAGILLLGGEPESARPEQASVGAAQR